MLARQVTVIRGSRVCDTNVGMLAGVLVALTLTTCKIGAHPWQHRLASAGTPGAQRSVVRFCRKCFSVRHAMLGPRASINGPPQGSRPCSRPLCAVCGHAGRGKPSRQQYVTSCGPREPGNSGAELTRTHDESAATRRSCGRRAERLGTVRVRLAATQWPATPERPEPDPGVHVSGTPPGSRSWQRRSS